MLLQSGSPLVLLAVLLGGLVTSLNPCVLVTVPVVVAYTAGSSQRSPARAFVLSAVFVLGMAATFTVLGLMAASAGRLLGDIGPVWRWLVAGVAFLMGANLLGLYDLPLPSHNLQPGRWRGLPGAFTLGALFGLVASPCATPVLAVILTYVASRGNMTLGAVLLLIYALGHSAVLILAGTFSGAARWLVESRRMAVLSVVMKRGAGVLMLLVGVWLVLDTLG